MHRCGVMWPGTTNFHEECKRLGEIPTLTALIHSARSDLDRARHSLRIEGFVQFAAEIGVGRRRSRRTTRKKHVLRKVIVAWPHIRVSLYSIAEGTGTNSFRLILDVRSTRLIRVLRCIIIDLGRFIVRVVPSKKPCIDFEAVVSVT